MVRDKSVHIVRDSSVICVVTPAHGGDQNSNIWMSRSYGFPLRSFECRRLCLLTWKIFWKFGDSPANVFDMYGDSRKNVFEILAVVIFLSPISSVCGFICVWWLIHMCVMIHSYVCHDSFICVWWLIHMCVMTHSYVCHDSFICVSWLIHMCVMTHSYVCGDSCVCVSWRNVMIWLVTKHHCIICDICAYSSWLTCMPTRCSGHTRESRTIAGIHVSHEL